MAVLDQDPAHKQAAMAVRRIFFAAQQSDAKLLHPAFQPFDSSRKCRIAFHPAVENMPLFVIVCRIGWAAAQLIAEEYIPDSALGEFFCENFAVELGRETRMRSGASVRNYIDLLAGQ